MLFVHLPRFCILLYIFCIFQKSEIMLELWVQPLRPSDTSPIFLTGFIRDPHSKCYCTPSPSLPEPSFCLELATKKPALCSLRSALQKQLLHERTSPSSVPGSKGPGSKLTAPPSRCSQPKGADNQGPMLGDNQGPMLGGFTGELPWSEPRLEGEEMLTRQRGGKG